MKSETNKSVVPLLAGLLIVTAAGCVQPSHMPASQGSESRGISDWLGNGRKTVGVTASPNLVYTNQAIKPTFRTISSQKGKSALRGFWAGFAVPMEPAVNLAESFGANLLGASAIVGGLGLGTAVGIAGAINSAASAEDVEVDTRFGANSSERMLQRHSLDHLKIEEAIQDRIALIGTEKSRHAFVILPHDTFSTEKISYQPNVQARRTLAARGIDGVLDIHVSSFGLSAGEGDNPRAKLRLSFRTLWFAEGVPFYPRTWKYEGQSRRLSAWAANDAFLFREELDRAIQALAAELVEDVFLQPK